MQTFWEFVHTLHLAESLRLLENFYPLDSDAYDALFAAELRKLAMQSPKGSKDLKSLEDFGFTRYISAAVRNSGIHDPRELQERSHDVAAKLLLGGLFSNYNPNTHGPFMARFSVAVSNAVRNQVALDRNRRRYLPRAPMSSDQLAARSRPSDETTIQDFRSLVGSRLGALGVAVLDSRLSGANIKSLIGSVQYGQPSAYRIKQTVLSIKQLAGEFARSRGDESFLRQVEKAMQAEEATVKRRVGARQVGSEVTG